MNILTENYKLYNGDCLKVMDKLISQNVVLDMVFTDMPYGITSRNTWDEVIPFNEIWERLNKLVKPNGAILLFSDEPFTSKLICSNIKNFKYRITWDKQCPSGFLNAKRMPLKRTEDICVFYKKLPMYNPQMAEAKKENIRPIGINNVYTSNNYGEHTVKNDPNYDNTKRYPTNLYSLSKISKDCNTTNRIHPTQKPVELLENWIKTYTNEGETVLDFTMGSGSTGVACLNCNRKFIGIELEKDYFDISINRIFENYSNNQ